MASDLGLVEIPTVSIIVPAYNAQLTLRSALNSALAQTGVTIEVLVVDDGSSDETARIASEMARSDPRVRLLRAALNRGPAAARNLGLRSAVGHWVALLDADDAFRPDRLARLLALAGAHRADMVSDNLLLVRSEDQRAAQPMLSPVELASPFRLTATGFVVGNVGPRDRPRVSYGFMQPMIRRAFLERHAIVWDERNRFGEDFLFCMACLLNGAVWWVTPEPMYFYTVTPGSLTERQSVDDLARLRAAARRWLADPAIRADTALVVALERLCRRMDRNYHYRRFTDAVKRRQPGQAVSALFETAESFGHVVRETAHQAPTIAAKAIVGGYGFRRGRTLRTDARTSGGTRRSA